MEVAHKMTISTHKLGNALLYPGANVKKLIRAAQQWLNPNWLTHLEQAAEGKIHWVSPKEIRWVSREKFTSDKTGQVLDGDWDDLSLPFEQLDFYQAFMAVVYEIYTWSQTPFFQRTLSRLKAGQVEWGCRTKDELQARLHTFDKLYRKVRAADRMTHYRRDPLSVNIGRHGDLLLNEGEHWLAIAKILDLPRVPIVIAGRHRQWVEFKHEIMAYTLQQPNSALYSPLLYPDLAWIPAHRGHERFELIQGALLSRGGTMLDIGCNLGYFCHRFEDLGFTCTGIEFDSTNFYFLEKLKRAANKQFQAVNHSIFDYIQQEPRRYYDVVLALAVFHHFIKSESNLHQLKNLLANLNVGELYFQPAHRWDPQMRGAYWNPAEEEFVAFILEHSNLNHATYLGRQSGGRPLYRLSV
jgi:2-polyprenyl-3-methyl-5-hydroxy-6-metoxy-1,4-benzoquinol methylase